MENKESFLYQNYESVKITTLTDVIESENEAIKRLAQAIDMVNDAERKRQLELSALDIIYLPFKNLSSKQQKRLKKRMDKERHNASKIPNIGKKR